MLVVLVPLGFILNVLLMIDVDVEVDAGPPDSIYRDFYSVPSHFLETVQLPIQQLMHCKICKRRIHHFSDARWMYRIKYTTHMLQHKTNKADKGLTQKLRCTHQAIKMKQIYITVRQNRTKWYTLSQITVT